MGELRAEETSVGGVEVPEMWEEEEAMEGEEEGRGIERAGGGMAVEAVEELALALVGEFRLATPVDESRLAEEPLGPLSHRAQNAKGVLLLDERSRGVALHLAQISSVRTHPFSMYSPRAADTSDMVRSEERRVGKECRN